MELRERPLGVTILAVLVAVSGIVSLILSAAVLLLYPLAFTHYHFTTIHVPLMFIGAFFLALGAVNLALSYGLWLGLRWSWFFTLVFSSLSLLLGILTLNTFSIIINLAVVYYLTRPYVRKYFGV